MLQYAITSGTLLPKPLDGDRSRNVYPAHQPLLRQAQSLAQSGVDYLQLREKSLPPAELVALARAVLAVLKGSPTRLLINSRLDIALATRAPGVHLTARPGGLTPPQIRDAYRLHGLSTPIISKSCHTLSEVLAARHHQADLILFSPIFGKLTLPGIGTEKLAQACAAAHPIPVLALGGITHQNTPSCLTAGARGIAGIRLFAPS